MPSHVTHMLFAQDVLAGIHDGSQLATGEWVPYLVLGAQGPDIFFHNQHRRPTGLAYGSLMHRRGYGRAVAHMWRRAHELDEGFPSWAAAWIIGFASHAILDRHTHPYINSFSGWPESGREETRRFRSMHPFLERLVDVELLRRREARHPNELDFATLVCPAPEPPRGWTEIMAYALRNSYAKASRDAHLEERLRSAYLDTMGYYRFTNYVDAHYLEQGLAREERDEIGRRWLSIVHPPAVPAELDVLNLRHREWVHPCSSHELGTESLPDLYERAVVEGTAMVKDLREVWNETPDRAMPVIERAVANWNLSDGRATEHPCTKRHANPLPLREFQDELREWIRDGRIPGSA